MNTHRPASIDGLSIRLVVNAHVGGADSRPAGDADDPPGDGGPSEAARPPASDGYPPPIDAETLFKRWAGMPELVKTILGKFEAQAGPDLERLEQSIAAGDAGETQRLAHGLKGAAGYIAADRVRELAAQLEAMGRDAELAGAEACLEQLRDELAQCLASIPQVLARAGGGDAATERSI